MKAKIHKFVQNGTYILLDINSGAVHVIDKMIYDIMDTFTGENDAEVIAAWENTYKKDDLIEALDELHALMDAMLGAAALGDIGQHFPDNDERYAGADSMQLLHAVRDLLDREGYELVNADCTILAQRPKLMPHIPQMRQNIAQTLKTEIDRISVKATTEEGLGFTGDGSGIAAHAVVLIEKK